MKRDTENFGSVTYEELFTFYKREIYARLCTARQGIADDVTYHTAMDSAKSLYQSFLFVGEMVINKHLFENQITGEPFSLVRNRFSTDYNELNTLISSFESSAE